MSNGRRRNPKAYEGFQGKVEQTLARSEPWWPPSPTAPPGAPNVIVMLVDELGFSDLGSYGSEIDTPNLDRLAAEGIRFSNFHATPLCAPTRAALLTGLNHHNAGVGAMGDDMGFPGYRTHLAENTLTMAEIFRTNGYSTFHVGKWHLAGITPREASNQNWPIQRGFDRHYGFLDGFTTYHSPLRLTQDNTFLDIDNYPDGYFLNDDLTDRAIAMIRTMRAADHARPFLPLLCALRPSLPTAGQGQGCREVPRGLRSRLG